MKKFSQSARGTHPSQSARRTHPSQSAQGTSPRPMSGCTSTRPSLTKRPNEEQTRFHFFARRDDQSGLAYYLPTVLCRHEKGTHTNNQTILKLVAKVILRKNQHFFYFLPLFPIHFFFIFFFFLRPAPREVGSLHKLNKNTVRLLYFRMNRDPSTCPKTDCPSLRLSYLHQFNISYCTQTDQRKLLIILHTPNCNIALLSLKENISPPPPQLKKKQRKKKKKKQQQLEERKKK